MRWLYLRAISSKKSEAQRERERQERLMHENIFHSVNDLRKEIELLKAKSAPEAVDASSKEVRGGPKEEPDYQADKQTENKPRRRKRQNKSKKS